MYRRLKAIPSLLLATLVVAAASARSDNGPEPFRYSYYLFEAPGKVENCSDCYIPLLVTRKPLDEDGGAEAAVIITYERDSVWKLSASPATLDKAGIQAAERMVRFEGKVYRYQRVPNEEVIRLLEHPLGRLPVHRREPPISNESEPLRQVLLRDLRKATDDAAAHHAGSTELGDVDGLLWVLNGDKGDDYNGNLVKKLETRKVPTAEEARAVALGHKLKAGGLRAEEGAKVVGLLRLGVDVAGFASSGDLVWVVRISHLSRGVSQEMWISSTSGAVRTMLPVQGNAR